MTGDGGLNVRCTDAQTLLIGELRRWRTRPGSHTVEIEQHLGDCSDLLTHASGIRSSFVPGFDRRSPTSALRQISNRG